MVVPYSYVLNMALFYDIFPSFKHNILWIGSKASRLKIQSITIGLELYIDESYEAHQFRSCALGCNQVTKLLTNQNALS